MMEARVRESYFLPTAQSAGLEFTKREWRGVPEYAEAEVRRAPFLEIKGELEPDQFEPDMPSNADADPAEGEEELPFWMPDLLEALELEVPAALAGVPDEDILAVDGVGQARLRDVRELYPAEGEEE